MPASSVLLPLVAAVLLSACSAVGSDSPPRSTFQSPANNLSPQPPGSLPQGFTTLHPLDPDTGNLATFRTP